MESHMRNSLISVNHTFHFQCRSIGSFPKMNLRQTRTRIQQFGQDEIASPPGCREPTPNPNGNQNQKSLRLLQSLSGVPRTHAKPEWEFNSEIASPPAEPLWGAANLRQTRTRFQFRNRLAFCKAFLGCRKPTPNSNGNPTQKSPCLLQSLSGVPRTHATPERESNSETASPAAEPLWGVTGGGAL